METSCGYWGVHYFPAASQHSLAELQALACCPCSTHINACGDPAIHSMHMVVFFQAAGKIRAEREVPSIYGAEICPQIRRRRRKTFGSFIRSAQRSMLAVCWCVSGPAPCCLTRHPGPFARVWGHRVAGFILPNRN